MQTENIGKRYEATKEQLVKKGKRGAARILYGRSVLIVLSVFLQIFALYAVAAWLTLYQGIAFWVLNIIGFVLVMFIVNGKSNPAFKMAWIVPIVLFPIFGGLLYLLMHAQTHPRRLRRLLETEQKRSAIYMHTEDVIRQHLSQESKHNENLAHFVETKAGFPTYQNTKIRYFASGEEVFSEILKALEKAEKFIFMDFFIIEPGVMWDAVLKILKQKAKEGVEIRVMYDGLCSLSRLPYSYPKQMREWGIACRIFAPIAPFFSSYQNNRDHHKILVIDGKVAYNGGVNFADEYINQYDRFGYWKDNMIELRGEAVRGFTVMFLQMWYADVRGSRKKQDIKDSPARIEREYGFYLTGEVNSLKVGHLGFVMPYADSPLDDVYAGEMVYMDLINTAERYVHIMTPYLILDNEMITALIYAASRGVDVKIILPHIPDKKVPFALARNHYPQLIEAGIKIYEFLPGFVHAKMFTVDDKRAVIGSVNMDYRSFYLHFECATYLLGCPVIADMEEDFQKTLLQSREMTEADYMAFPLTQRMIGHLFKFVAPFM